MKKAYSLFCLVVLISLQAFATKILNVINVTEEAMGNSAKPGQVIKVQIDYESGPIKPGPFWLYLEGNKADIRAFENSCQDGQIQTLYFYLNESEIAKAVSSIEHKALIKLDVGDNNGNLTNARSPNFTLEFFGKESLLLKQSSWRLDKNLGVSIQSYQRFAQLPSNRDNIKLYVNGILLENAACSGITLTPEGADIFFKVDGAEFGKLFYENESEQKVKIGIGTVESSKYYADKELTVEFMRSGGKTLFWVIFILIGSIIFLLAAKTDMIKDKALGNDRKSYSLARTQFAFWTFFILNAMIYIFFTTKELCDLPSSAFILLGISATITIVSQLAEDKPGSSAMRKQVNNNKSKLNQFFSDLLSDGETTSIHRLQNLLFTLFLGFYFWWEVINHLVIPPFDTNLLVLMGVSGAAYTVKKGMAGNDSQQQPQDVPLPPSGTI